MKITYVGHSCFLVENEDGGKICFDPYKPGSVPGYSDIDIAADEVIISHGHDDHSGDIYVDKAIPEYEDEFVIGKIRTFHDDRMGLDRGRNNIGIVTMDGMRVVHMGDIGCDITLAQEDILKHCDVLMIPVGGYYTINARQAFEMCNKIDPAVIIPMHYRGPSFGYDVLDGKDKFLSLFAGGTRKVINCGSTIETLPREKCVLSMEPLRIL